MICLCIFSLSPCSFLSWSREARFTGCFRSFGICRRLGGLFKLRAVYSGSCFLNFFWTSAEKFQTSPLVSAHPSWFLIESRSEIFAHNSYTLGPHQIPRGGSTPFLAPLRPKGRTRTPSMSLFTTLTGASWVTSTVCVCGLHFDLGVEQACSAAARVSSSQTFPGQWPSCTRRILLPRYAACGSFFGRLRFPFFLSFLFLISFAYSVGTSSGAIGRVSRLRRTSSLAIVSRTSSFLPIFSAGSPGCGAGGCFPSRDCVPLHCPFSQGCS